LSDIHQKSDIFNNSQLRPFNFRKSFRLLTIQYDSTVYNKIHRKNSLNYA